jgi:hypothetical protein
MFRALDHLILIKEFVNSVMSDLQPPVTGEEGRETVRDVEMLAEKLHRKYSIPEAKQS